MPVHSLPHFRLAARLLLPPSQVGVSRLTPSLLLVQLTIQQWKHSRRAHLLPPSRSSVPQLPAPSLFHQSALLPLLFSICSVLASSF
ncbi:uncharacterized protein DS421_14g472100 [Arachis hypogaea]|nr:uncharacterized protein DS421_14g472100 [Arachis hypogaea]